MGKKRCERKLEFGELVSGFDVDDVQFAARLIKSKIKKGGIKRVWDINVVDLGRPLIIGAELYMIGVVALATEQLGPAMSEPRWDGRQWAQGPMVRIVDQPGPLVAVGTIPKSGIILLAVGLVWWLWLACGGEALSIRAGGWGGTTLLLAPFALCFLAGLFWLRSVQPDMDLVNIGLKRS